MIEVDGVEEAQSYLLSLAQKAEGNWEALEDLATGLVRYAVSISPVVTGSYAGSHRATFQGKTATISIDPTARNSETGQPVIRYAGSVEARHRVYGQVWAEANRLAVSTVEDLGKELT